MKSIGIKELTIRMNMVKKDWTGQQLADKLGITRQAVHIFFTALRNGTAKQNTIERYAAALGIEVEKMREE